MSQVSSSLSKGDDSARFLKVMQSVPGKRIRYAELTVKDEIFTGTMTSL